MKIQLKAAVKQIDSFAQMLQDIAVNTQFTRVVRKVQGQNDLRQN